jgi:hypothetical protein
LCQSESAFHHVKAGPGEHPVKKTKGRHGDEC